MSDYDADAALVQHRQSLRTLRPWVIGVEWLAGLTLISICVREPGTQVDQAIMGPVLIWLGWVFTWWWPRV